MLLGKGHLEDREENGTMSKMDLRTGSLNGVNC
jgi:hypothetical protein